MFPKDEAGFSIDDQYYIGSSGLLVKPVTTKGATETTVYLSDKEVREFVLGFNVSRCSRMCLIRHTTITSITTSTEVVRKKSR